MDRQQLEQWLGNVDSRSVGLQELAEILHLLFDASVDDSSRSSLALADAAELRTLRFAFAVLRDVFPSDEDVRAWLSRPSSDREGATPLGLLSRGRVNQFSDMAVAEWNRPRETVATKYHRTFAERGLPLGRPG